MKFWDERLPSRFWAKAVPRPSGCWLWFGAGNGTGYGKIYWKGKNALAHRLAYKQLVGDIPAGLQLDHTCRRRNCVNPAHLELVTPSENTRRGDAGKTRKPKTHCPQGHEYSSENTYTPPGRSDRQCRTCKREWMRRNGKKAQQEAVR